jgi:hypothetical protein
MNFTAYVKEEKIKARKKNIAEIRRDIDKSWVKEKIKNHMTAFEGLFTYDEIKQQILSNDLVASKFCKDPSKQNISENLAAQVLGWEKMPSQGSHCIRFNDNGDIVFTSSGNTKSADFHELGYYITQKYTDGEGGAQDNQRNDVIDFLKRGSIKNKVMAVVDGDYWDLKYRNILIEEFKDNPNVKITSVTELTTNI